METLLDAADALLASHPDEPPRPDFAVPPDFDPATLSQLLDLRDDPVKGLGWFAKTTIPPGTLVLCEKATAMVMDGEDDDNDEEDVDAVDGHPGGDDDDANPNTTTNQGEPRINVVMYLDLLEAIHQKPDLWTESLSKLYPRTEHSMAKLPAFVIADDESFVEVETLLNSIPNDTVRQEIAKRLPLIIRYNIMSVETCPELLIHPGPDGHAALSGMGLFLKGSFFNHNSRPNVSRYAVGDIMWFVTNQQVQAGEELCLSYLEHDVLCEPASRRTHMLGRDFVEVDDANVEGDQGPDLPVVDAEVQNQLMAIDPIQRLDDLKVLMGQAMGKARPQDEDEPLESIAEDREAHADVPEEEGGDVDEVRAAGWFQCDVHNLRIIQAITLDGLGQATQALPLWEQCVDFAETKLPPNDEASVVMRVQAALCAQRAGQLDRAHKHSRRALQTHHLLFGGGIARFQRRYAKELKLALRPETDENGTPEDLWNFA